MATPVDLPKSGNTVEECVISRWVKRQGDAVSAGDIVAEIETDKATFEIAAPVGGTLLATFFEEGALVPVFTTVCVIGSPGEAFDELRPGTAVPRVIPHPQPLIPPASASLSPRARAFAAEHQFQPTAVVGSGPGGRVLERDVRKAYESVQKPAAVLGGSGTRDIIARRLRESLATTAQYTLHGFAGAAGLLALRAQAKTDSRPGAPHITINTLVTFCAIRALLEMPDLNAELIGGRIVRHNAVHMGFACDTPRGLLVPVVRDAHTLGIGDLGRRMSDLTTQAVDGRISPDHLTGATFTISNLGGLGVEAFTPVINVPQVAILGVGAVHVKPVRVGGRVEFIDAIGLSLTCDHQVIDGAPGGRFLRLLKDKIERVDHDSIVRGS